MTSRSSPDHRGFHGKTVLVTGACRSPGREVALTFARQGARLALFDWNRHPLANKDAVPDQQEMAALAREVETFGAPVVTFRGDIRNEADVSRVVAKTLTVYGSLDVVFHGMQVPSAGVCWDPFEEDWDTVIDVNLKGAWLLAKWAVPEMARRGGGLLVNNAAGEGSCLWGIADLTRSLVPSLEAQGISARCAEGSMGQTPWDVLGWARERFSLRVG